MPTLLLVDDEPNVHQTFEDAMALADEMLDGKSHLEVIDGGKES